MNACVHKWSPWRLVRKAGKVIARICTCKYCGLDWEQPI